jgi:hypothetical protein
MKKQKAVPMTDSELDALMTTPRVQNLIEAAVSKSHNMYVLHSILQKANRRDFEHDALEAAWELDMVAGDRQTKSRAGGMWSILRRCCSEDVSLANSGLVLEIEGLWRFWEKQTESANNRHEPWRLFTWDAVLRICRSPKCRIVDHIAQVIPHGKLAKIVKEFRETKKSRMVIPAYGRDGIHDGGMRGGILADFLINEDAALTPKADGIDDPYKREIDAALASVDPKADPESLKPTKRLK